MLYEDDLPLKDKVEVIAREIYGADGVVYTKAAEKSMKKITDMGFGNFPVCIAKTQYSLSDDPKQLGRPEHFDLHVREVYVSAGAGLACRKYRQQRALMWMKTAVSPVCSDRAHILQDCKPGADMVYLRGYL